MRLVLKDYLLQLREKDELDSLICDLLLQMGYITDSKPETGNRQYGVDIRAHNTKEILLCVVKQGNLKRSNWDVGENAVRQSLNDIQDVYMNLIGEKERKKKLHIAVITNGVIDEATRPNWEGYVKNHTLWGEMKVDIEFWGIDELVDYIQKYLFDEYLFGFEMQGIMRKALYFIGEADYRNHYFEEIIDQYIAQFDIADSTKLFKKKIAGLYLASQMIAQYAEKEHIYKIGIMVSEYLIIRYWKYMFEHNCLGKTRYIEWLQKFLKSYEKWNFKYYEAVRDCCEKEERFPAYNPIEQRVILYEVLGYLVSYAYYLSFKGEACQMAKQICQQIYNSIVNLLNNCLCFPYAPYDNHIGIISMLYRLFGRLGREEDLITLLKQQCTTLAYYYILYQKYPTPEDSFQDAVNIYMGFPAADYSTSAFWGTMLEWIVLMEQKDLYIQLYPFLKEKLESVTKCTWFLRSEEEGNLYDNYAMNLAGDGVAFFIEESYEQMKSNVEFVMKQYEEELFSFDEYSFPALEFIICRYYSYLPRIRKG